MADAGMSSSMYSTAWFTTFAASIPERVTEMEADAIASFAPPAHFPRLLDLGCGVGRVAAALQRRGYGVTGIDISAGALRSAHRAVPEASFVALDQRHVGHMRWEFDVIVSIWNSLGFATREDDADTLAGLHRVLSERGRLLLDLFHPHWLEHNDRAGHRDPRGATIDRWVRNGRCYHEIRYADGSVDDIQFNVYTPDEMTSLLRRTGFQVAHAFAWWDSTVAPGAEHARYQLVAERRP
jgi:SAM-dependent methyltransferase